MNNSLLIYVYSCYMFVVTKKCYNFKNELTNINNAAKKNYIFCLKKLITIIIFALSTVHKND